MDAPLHLGKTSNIPNSPDEAVLDAVPNPQVGTLFVARFICPEMTSLCLSGDTLIDICCDEEKHPKGVPIADLVGTSGLLYSFDPDARKPVVKPYFNVRRTRRNAKLLRITMLSRKGTPLTREEKIVTIDVTPDHPFLVSKGFKGHEWVTAGNLKPNDRIFSDQRARASDLIRGEARHRLIAESITGRPLHHGEVAHHKNHRHFDNTPTNIEVMVKETHFSHHQTVKYGYNEVDWGPIIDRYRIDPTLGIAAIAREMRCDQSTVKKRLLECGVSIWTQPEILVARNAQRLAQQMSESQKLYAKGYMTNEIASYFGVGGATITQWLKKSGVVLRSPNAQRWGRRDLDLPALNHKVLSVDYVGRGDVYDLEVEGTHCFFANEVVVHNCPVTGQPDFATIVIDYVPENFLLESKSLKLFIFSFRNHGAFHEDCTVMIGKRIQQAIRSQWIRVCGFWYPRGGIPIDVSFQWPGNPPADVHVLPFEMPLYRGR